MVKVQNVNESEERILVSSDAIAKLMALAEIMEDSEFRVISVTQNPRRVIDDFIIPVQDVEPARVHSEGLSWVQDYSSITSVGFIPVGVAHGHGRFDPFHSETDHVNFDKVLNECWANNLTTEYLAFDFSRQKIEKRDGLYILRSFSDLDAELMLPESLFGGVEPAALNDLAHLQLKKGCRGEVSSIVVNNAAGKVYGAKRFRDIRFFLMEPELREEQGDYPEYYFRKGLEQRYTKKAIVEVVDSARDICLDRDGLVAELKSKLTFIGSYRPSSFRTKVAVVHGLASLPDKGVKDEGVEKNAKDKKTVINTIIEKLSGRNASKGRYVQEVDAKKDAGITRAKVVENSYHGIIRCDPDLRFDDIVKAYQRRSLTVDYALLSSTCNRIRDVLSEASKVYSLPSRRTKPLEELLLVNLARIDETRSAAIFDAGNSLREIDSFLVNNGGRSLDDTGVSSLMLKYRELLHTRNAFYALEDEGRATHADSLMRRIQTRLIEYHDQHH